VSQLLILAARDSLTISTAQTKLKRGAPTRTSHDANLVREAADSRNSQGT